MKSNICELRTLSNYVNGCIGTDGIWNATAGTMGCQDIPAIGCISINNVIGLIVIICLIVGFLFGRYLMICNLRRCWKK